AAAREIYLNLVPIYFRALSVFGLSLRYLTGSNDCAFSPGFTCQTSTLTIGSNNWLYVRQLLIDKNQKNTELSSANCYQTTPLGITVTRRTRSRSDVPDAS
ncbi:MAG: hypothetical protein VXZ41_09190, partial [Pseudomonadota bacterium]|nr:hypothetical protein [Pseudomonadota bacterium]